MAPPAWNADLRSARAAPRAAHGVTPICRVVLYLGVHLHRRDVSGPLPPRADGGTSSAGLRPAVPTGGRRSRPYAPSRPISPTRFAGLRPACRLKPAFQAARVIRGSGDPRFGGAPFAQRSRRLMTRKTSGLLPAMAIYLRDDQPRSTLKSTKSGRTETSTDSVPRSTR